MARLSALLLFFGLLPTCVFADLLPPELRLSLRQIKSQSTQYILLELKIQNASALHGSILVPGHPQLGLGLFEVYRYQKTGINQFRLDSTFSLVLKDSSTVDTKYMQFWSLAPGESFKQLIHIHTSFTENDVFMVKYQPHVCKEWFQYAFRWHDEEGESKEPIDESDQRFAYQGAFYSNYLELEPITNVALLPINFSNKAALKKAIYKEQWGRVERRLKYHVPSFSDSLSTYPILGKQIYSQAVLSSLPTYYYQYLIVETESGLHYLYFGYQLGKIYRGRSFFAKIAHLCGARRVFWQTSSVNKNQLKVFKVQPFKKPIL
jgi:hypothetical protein